MEYSWRLSSSLSTRRMNQQYGMLRYDENLFFVMSAVACSDRYRSPVCCPFILKLPFCQCQPLHLFSRPGPLVNLEWPWTKVKQWPWPLVLICFHVLSQLYMHVPTSQTWIVSIKSGVQGFFHTKALGSSFDLAVKKVMVSPISVGCITIWATSWENLFMPCANNRGADQPAHLRSLISAFVVRCLDSVISLLAIAEISRP